MKVLLTSRAKKQLSKLPKMAQIAIFKKLRMLIMLTELAITE